MKKLILLGMALVPVLALAQNNFTLKIKITGLDKHAKAHINYSQAGKFINDSLTMKNGLFVFSGTITEPVRAELQLDHNGKSNTVRNFDQIYVYLEKGTISVTGKDSVKHAAITGSPVNADEKRFAAMIESGPNKSRKEIFEIQKQFIQQNPDSYISLEIVSELSTSDIDTHVLKSLYQSLTESKRNTPTGKKTGKYIETLFATMVGEQAPLFTQNDVNDKPVSLAGFRGKYVLLDFWASWCGPCRKENPNYVKAYNQYKDKNFTILSVSLDRPGKKDAWLAAIKADGLEWTQVSDLKFWNNDVAVLYGINAVPQNFLIDPSGKIIAKDLRGKELTDKLATLFN